MRVIMWRNMKRFDWGRIGLLDELTDIFIINVEDFENRSAVRDDVIMRTGLPLLPPCMGGIFFPIPLSP